VNPHGGIVRHVTPSLRRSAALAVLLIGALLAFPGQSGAAIPEACSPTDASFCVAYGYQVLEAGQPLTNTTQSQAPVDLEVDFTNTSAGYRDEAGQPRWLSAISANLLSSGTIRPMITGSSALPEGLLVAGDPTSSPCVPGGDYAYTDCSAGRGTAFVKTSGLLTGVYTATFGIKQVRNEKVGLGSHFSQYAVTVGVCVEVPPLGSCVGGEKVQTVTFTIDLPPTGQPMVLDFVMPPPSTTAGVTLERFTLDHLRLKLNGQSDLLADGTVLLAGLDVVRLPMRCGTVSAGGTATSVSGATVTVPGDFTVTGCSQLNVTASKTKVVYGGSATIAGTLTDFDSGTPMVGTAVQLRACATSATVPCATIKQTKLTTTGGAFSFTVKPSKNTRYFVRVGIVDGKPASYVDKRINVAPKITRTASRTTMPSGGTVRLTGAVAPNHAGKVVSIQRLKAGVWKTIAHATLGSKSKYAKSLVLKGAHGSKARLRVVLPAHADHVTGISPTVAITFS
jgi:hypothetical protein